MTQCISVTTEYSSFQYHDVNGPPRRQVRRVEAGFTPHRNRLALFLRPFPPLRLRRPLRIPHRQLRQYDHPRRRPFLLQLVWQHHHDSRRNYRRTPRPPSMRHLFLLPTRTTGFAFSTYGLFENFPYIGTYMADARSAALPLVGSEESDWTFSLASGDSSPKTKKSAQSCAPWAWHARHHDLAGQPRSPWRGVKTTLAILIAG